jgi:methyl-accepting chemotaxis protein
MVSHVGARPPAILRPALVAVGRMRTGTRLGVLVLALVIPVIMATYAHPSRPPVLWTTVGALLTAAWFGTAVVWRTRQDISRTLTVLTAMAAGDFAGRPLPAGGDELGDLGRALDTARSRLADQQARLSADQAEREEELRGTFQQQRQAELRLRDRAQAIIDESTAIIADELRQVTKQVGDVRHASDTIDSGIAATDAATSAVVDHARRAEEVIALLERSLRRVASTAALVQGIAGQTRLLALNATIEAARAGKLGLGFTVVADEVKELATTTSRSTEQIAETINELERDTAEMSATIAAMVAGIGSVGAAATSLRAVATDQGTVVGRLTDRMGQTIDRVERMSGVAAQLERRHSDRVVVSGTVRLRRSGSGELTPATLLNLSSGGMRVRVDPSLHLAVGDVVHAELADGSERLTLNARVANLEPDDGGDVAGMAFLVPDDATAHRIDRYLDRQTG